VNATTLNAVITRAINARAHIIARRKSAAREDAADAFRLLGEALGLDTRLVALALVGEHHERPAVFDDWSKLYEATGRQVLECMGLDPGQLNVKAEPVSILPADDYAAACRDGRVTEERSK
jgi:hypothetical protein